MKNDAALKAAAQAAVQSLMSRLHGVRGCVVSTEDGFEVAARAQGQGRGWHQTSRTAGL